MNREEHCIYEHWEPGAQYPFYVGQGKGKRAFSLGDRSKNHRAVIAELALRGLKYEVKIVRIFLTKDTANTYEVELIAKWRANGATLVNKTIGGSGTVGCALTPEHRAKLSAMKKGKPLPAHMHEAARIANIGNRYTKGKKLSPEHRARLSERLKGNTHTKGQKRNPSAVEASAAWHTGKKRSDETRAKIAASQQGKKLSDETKVKISIARLRHYAMRDGVA